MRPNTQPDSLKHVLSVLWLNKVIQIYVTPSNFRTKPPSLDETLSSGVIAKEASDLQILEYAVSVALELTPFLKQSMNKLRFCLI